MRVAIIRQRYTDFGGAERFLGRAVDALAQRGVHITMLARDWPEHANRHLINPKYITRTGRDRGFAQAVCNHLKNEKYDLVQSHERIPCCDLYRAGDGVHREWLKQRKRFMGWKAAWADRMPYHRYILDAESRLFNSQQLKAVVCNSAMVKQELMDHFDMPSHKLHVIYSGIDSDRFHPDLKEHRHSVREQWKIPQDVPLFLFVGSGFERKGVGPLLQALAQMPKQAYLLIVGKDKKRSAYQTLAKKLGLSARVRFCGPQKDVRPFYGAADGVALPTLYDPFPNVALEAMACGLPLLSSTKSGAMDLIESGHNGWLCDALDIETMAQHLLSMCDTTRNTNVGKAARATVEPLSLDAMATQMEDLYTHLLNP
ncbi:glycosyltransferase family 4 protein [Magnetococcus sp. PR-3]|uniref:glycosyltransferase family 4 protein n=1 Tax=Magnetococcus sp. PR-3 TaxID=3120355 RepID=UPI002FCE3206